MTVLTPREELAGVADHGPGCQTFSTFMKNLDESFLFLPILVRDVFNETHLLTDSDLVDD